MPDMNSTFSLAKPLSCYQCIPQADSTTGDLIHDPVKFNSLQNCLTNGTDNGILEHCNSLDDVCAYGQMGKLLAQYYLMF